jgi:hypothetical protein
LVLRVLTVVLNKQMAALLVEQPTLVEFRLTVEAAAVEALTLLLVVHLDQEEHQVVVLAAIRL